MAHDDIADPSPATYHAFCLVRDHGQSMPADVDDPFDSPSGPAFCFQLRYLPPCGIHIPSSPRLRPSNRAVGPSLRLLLTKPGLRRSPPPRFRTVTDLQTTPS
ncbi:hypothetical protein PSPO01_02726 [Paraphaeosphaeria sporulosa]